MRMKFIHISDLHIGKKLKEMSLEEDQRHILRMILDIVRDQKPDGVIIAGDVYDTTTPTNESVTMLDEFLTELADLDTDVFIISGNHDSPEKLGFGSRLFERNRLFISGTFKGRMDVHTVTKGEESIDICMLPFIKPVHVRRLYPEEKIENYTDAVRCAIEHTDLTEGRRRILVTHQFVVGNGEEPVLSDSESVFVGGTEAVDASVFKGFDYVALGHIHRPQSVGRDTIRYSGTPLKYSLSEADDQKSVTVVDIGENVSVSTIPLMPLRDIRRIRGPLSSIIEEGKKDTCRDDFVYVDLLTDEIDALARLREVYPNVMQLRNVNSETSDDLAEMSVDPESWGFDIKTAFSDFFKSKTGEDLTEKQSRIVSDLVDEEVSE